MPSKSSLGTNCSPICHRHLKSKVLLGQSLVYLFNSACNFHVEILIFLFTILVIGWRSMVACWLCGSLCVVVDCLLLFVVPGHHWR